MNGITSAARIAPTALAAATLAILVGLLPGGARADAAAKPDFVPFVTDFPKPVAKPFVPFVTDFPKPVADGARAPRVA
jgi:hypothetical protein